MSNSRSSARLLKFNRWTLHTFKSAVFNSAVHNVLRQMEPKSVGFISRLSGEVSIERVHGASHLPFAKAIQE